MGGRSSVCGDFVNVITVVGLCRFEVGKSRNSYDVPFRSYYFGFGKKYKLRSCIGFFFYSFFEFSKYSFFPRKFKSIRPQVIRYQKCIRTPCIRFSKMYSLRWYSFLNTVKTLRIRQHFRTRPSTFAQTISSRIYDTFIFDTKYLVFP